MKFLACADVHLRDSQYGRTSRSQDFLNAFSAVIDQAVNQEVDFIVCAGDLLNSTRPSPQLLRELRKFEERLQELKLPCYVVAGNHDLTRPYWTEAFKDNDLEDFGFVILDDVRLELVGTSIVGIPFCSREAFLTGQEFLKPVDVLIWHGSIREFCGFPSPNSLSLRDLDPSKFRVMVVGDIHVTRQERLGDSLVISPGSTELCDTGEDAKKTVTIVTLEPGDDATYEVIPLDTRKVLRFRLLTEEDVEKALAEIEPVKAADPMVFLDYAPELAGEIPRFFNAMTGTSQFVRPSPLTAKKTANNGRPASMMKIANPRDLIPAFIVQGHPAHELACALLNPEAEASEMVDEWLAGRKRDLDIRD